jgi:hypothetical protein
MLIDDGCSTSRRNVGIDMNLGAPSMTQLWVGIHESFLPRSHPERPGAAVGPAFSRPSHHHGVAGPLSERSSQWESLST